MPQRVVCEFDVVKRCIVTKKIFFMEAGKDFVVYEQELVPDRFSPLGRDNEWKQVFFMPFPQRNLARSCFVGRIAMAAYEEGNNDG